MTGCVVLFCISHQFSEMTGNGAILTPRGLLEIADGSEQSLHDLETELENGDSTMTRLSAAEAVKLVPFLREDRIHSACYEPSAMDIDVDLLLQSWNRKYKTEGGEVRVNSRIVKIEKVGRSWSLITSRGETIVADVVVNAAGAWGDDLAKLAGIKPINLKPLKRSMAVIPPPMKDVDRYLHPLPHLHLLHLLLIPLIH